MAKRNSYLNRHVSLENIDEPRHPNTLGLLTPQIQQVQQRSLSPGNSRKMLKVARITENLNESHSSHASSNNQHNSNGSTPRKKKSYKLKNLHQIKVLEASSSSSSSSDSPKSSKGSSPRVGKNRFMSIANRQQTKKFKKKGTEEQPSHEKQQVDSLEQQDMPPTELVKPIIQISSPVVSPPMRQRRPSMAEAVSCDQVKQLLEIVEVQKQLRKKSVNFKKGVSQSTDNAQLIDTHNFDQPQRHIQQQETIPNIKKFEQIEETLNVSPQKKPSRNPSFLKHQSASLNQEAKLHIMAMNVEDLRLKSQEGGAKIAYQGNSPRGEKSKSVTHFLPHHSNTMSPNFLFVPGQGNGCLMPPSSTISTIQEEEHPVPDHHGQFGGPQPQSARRNSINPINSPQGTGSIGNQIRSMQQAIQLKRRTTVQKFDNAIKALTDLTKKEGGSNMSLNVAVENLNQSMRGVNNIQLEGAKNGKQQDFEENYGNDLFFNTVETMQSNRGTNQVTPLIQEQSPLNFVEDQKILNAKKKKNNQVWDSSRRTPQLNNFQNKGQRRSIFEFIKLINPFGGKVNDGVQKTNQPLRRAQTFQKDIEANNGEMTPTPLRIKMINPNRGKELWRKTRTVIRAVNTWKSVRNDVLLYGTHNYEFRNTFNVVTQHEVNLQQLTPIRKKSIKSKVKPFGMIKPMTFSRRLSVSMMTGLQSQQSSRDEQVKKMSIFDIKNRGGLYFHPESKFKQFWSLVIICLLLYVVILMPYSLAFQDDSLDTIYDATIKEIDFARRSLNKGWSYYLDVIADFIFLTDIIIIFFSAYYDENKGVLVTSNKRIAVKYFKAWFCIDLLSSMPVSLIEDSISQMDTNIFGNSYQYIKMLRLLRLPRLHRLLEVSQLGKFFRTITKDSYLLKMQDFFQENAGMMRLLSIVFSVIACVHIAACFWYMTAKLSGFDPDSWVVRNGLSDEDNGKKYLIAVYWAVATILTVGYGDISGQTTLERLVSILWMMIGVAFYAFTIGIITSVLDRIDTKESHLNSKLETIDEFCQESHIPLELKKRIRESLEYHSDKNAFTVIQQKHNSVFQDLPVHIRYAVAMQIHEGAIGRIPFFQDKESTFVANIVPLLSPLKVEQGEYIYMKGDHPYEIYFLCSGRVNFLMDIGECVFKAWPKGAYFGDIEIIFDKRRICSAKAAPDFPCDFFILNKKHYQTMIHNDYPDIDKELRIIAQEREIKIEKALKKANEVLKAIGITDAVEEFQINDESTSKHAYRRAQSYASVSRISDHPAQQSAKNRITRYFHNADNKSFNASSNWSKPSIFSSSSSEIFTESSDEFEQSGVKQQKKSSMKSQDGKQLSKFSDKKFAAKDVVTPMASHVPKSQSEIISKTTNIKSTPQIVIEPGDSTIKNFEEEKLEVLHVGRKTIVLEPSSPSAQNISISSSQKIEESYTSSSSSQNSSQSGYNIWNDNKSSGEEEDKIDSNRDDRAVKTAGINLNIERLKTLNMLKNKMNSTIKSKMSNASKMTCEKPNESAKSDQESSSIQNIQTSPPKVVVSPFFKQNTLKRQTTLSRQTAEVFQKNKQIETFHLAPNTNLQETSFSQPSIVDDKYCIQTKVCQLSIVPCPNTHNILKERLDKLSANIAYTSNLEQKVKDLESNMEQMVHIMEKLSRKIHKQHESHHQLGQMQVDDNDEFMRQSNPGTASLNEVILRQKLDSVANTQQPNNNRRLIQSQMGLRGARPAFITQVPSPITRPNLRSQQLSRAPTQQKDSTLSPTISSPKLNRKKKKRKNSRSTSRNESRKFIEKIFANSQSPYLRRLP